MVLILMYMPQAYALLVAGAGALGQQGSVVVGKIQVRSNFWGVDLSHSEDENEKVLSAPVTCSSDPKPACDV
jgi:hypothetical protein